MVEPDDGRIVVSSRIREEFENGRQYYELRGRLLARPIEPAGPPAREHLLYQAQFVFLTEVVYQAS